MEILLVNGSTHESGATKRALQVVEKELLEKGVEVSWFEMKNQPVYGCVDCQSCAKTHRCAYTQDSCNELIEGLLSTDGVIVGSPVYFAGMNGSLKALLDRAFYATGTFGQLLKGKRAAALVCRYRSGGASALDGIYKYFVTSQMSIVGSVDYAEFKSNFDAEKDRFDSKVLRKLADQMAE